MNECSTRCHLSPHKALLSWRTGFPPKDLTPHHELTDGLWSCNPTAVKRQDRHVGTNQADEKYIKQEHAEWEMDPCGGK